VRDWLEQAQVNGKPWNKKAPAPPLPPDVIAQSAAQYARAADALMHG
jgi:phosphoribosylaminoimidazole-succinocarboxamide synthase